ncbi:MAG TPA: alpha/beta fold hydrolase [Kiritimatiellia bacterium]|nr:alpha/beta fold hydrolase [Kiritimatiellia bacterium]
MSGTSTTFRSLLWAGARIYLLVLLVMAACQRKLIYHPTRLAETAALPFAANQGLQPWRSSEGELIGWTHPSSAPSDRAMLVFHGNAGFAGHRGYLAQGFRPWFHVHILEYPGYGPRSGKPSETAFQLAASHALGELKLAGYTHIVLVGESLGSGVAARLAASESENVHGLFLITPFDSLVSVARGHYPFLPVRLLLRDRFESAKHLTNFHGPVAILLAERDEVVPARHGQALYDAYHGPKRIWIQSGRSHNTLDFHPGQTWWTDVAKFLLEDRD